MADAPARRGSDGSLGGPGMHVLPSYFDGSASGIDVSSPAKARGDDADDDGDFGNGPFSPTWCLYETLFVNKKNCLSKVFIHFVYKK